MHVVSMRPLQLRELVRASGGAWGGTACDALFVQFFQDCVGGVDFYNSLGAAAHHALEEAWEKAKHEWTPPAYSISISETISCAEDHNEEAGSPDEGIAPGTKWEDVPINWTCPECGARKDDFEMVQI